MEALKFYLCLFGTVILIMVSQSIDFGLLRIFFTGSVNKSLQTLLDVVVSLLNV